MIATFNHENLAKNLPDAFDKRAGSNNDKLLSIEKSIMDELRAAVNAVYDSLDIDKATGKTLDMYGEIVGQERGQATDEQYRILLKGRIVRNLSNGDYNSIVRAIATTLNCDPTEIVLLESDEPCKVQMRDMPFSVLNQMQIDLNTAMKLVQSLIPAGIWLESANFTGTFEFSGGTELVYDEAKGFADSTQTFGGTLGFVFNGNTPELPI